MPRDASLSDNRFNLLVNIFEKVRDYYFFFHERQKELRYRHERQKGSFCDVHLLRFFDWFDFRLYRKIIFSNN